MSVERRLPIGVSSEYVFDDNDGFLHHIIDFGLNKFQQDIDAALCCPLQADGAAPDGTYTAPYKINIHLCCIFLELKQYLHFHQDPCVKSMHSQHFEAANTLRLKQVRIVCYCP